MGKLKARSSVKKTVRKSIIKRPAEMQLEDCIMDLAVSGRLAKAGQKAVALQREHGLPVTYLNDEGKIVRELPDGKIEVLGEVKKAAFKRPKGVRVIAPH